MKITTKKTQFILVATLAAATLTGPNWAEAATVQLNGQPLQNFRRADSISGSHLSADARHF